MDEYDMYSSGMSIPEVSDKTGVALSTLRFRFKNAGILRSRIDGIRSASERGRLGSGLRGKKRVFSEEWKGNISKSKKGVGAGVSLKPNGYIEITMGKDKGRSQHSVIMENHIGRKLMSNECVHHIDHNRANNSIENLQLMTRSEHAKLHAIENINNRERHSNGRLK
tara:strand:+ start:412 stop:912 length:501 start_codon:yes stop_codon:yes gene_type:complete